MRHAADFQPEDTTMTQPQTTLAPDTQRRALPEVDARMCRLMHVLITASPAAAPRKAELTLL